VAHVGGGAICGVITLSSNGGLLLPVCCGTGTLVFSAIITSTLVYWLREVDSPMD